jgi:hypothetical protein
MASVLAVKTASAWARVRVDPHPRGHGTDVLSCLRGRVTSTRTHPRGRGSLRTRVRADAV